MTRELPDWSMLQAAISGEVILPESLAYETAQEPAKEHRVAFIVHSEAPTSKATGWCSSSYCGGL